MTAAFLVFRCAALVLAFLLARCSSKSDATYAQPPAKKQVWFSYTNTTTAHVKTLLHSRLAPLHGERLGDNWIVVTTINADTPTMRR